MGAVANKHCVLHGSEFGKIVTQSAPDQQHTRWHPSEFVWVCFGCNSYLEPLRYDIFLCLNGILGINDDGTQWA